MHVCVVDGVFILSQVVQCCAGTSYAESLNIPKLVDKYPSFRRKITFFFLFFCFFAVLLKSPLLDSGQILPGMSAAYQAHSNR